MTTTAVATPDPCPRRPFRNAIAARMELNRLDAGTPNPRRTGRFDPRMDWCPSCRAWHVTHPAATGGTP